MEATSFLTNSRSGWNALTIMGWAKTCHSRRDDTGGWCKHPSLVWCSRFHANVQKARRFYDSQLERSESNLKSHLFIINPVRQNFDNVWWSCNVVCWTKSFRSLWKCSWKVPQILQVSTREISMPILSIDSLQRPAMTYLKNLKNDLVPQLDARNPFPTVKQKWARLNNQQKVWHRRQ